MTNKEDLENIDKHSDNSYLTYLVNEYEKTYYLRQQVWYENYSQTDGITSYEEVAKMCSYPTSTIIVDTGDVSYLVLRPNEEPFKLDPFFDVCEDSIDSSYSGALMSTLAPLPSGIGLVRYLPGVDSFDYPGIDTPFSIGMGYDLYEDILETIKKNFQDLNLDEEKNFLLGRKLIIAALKMDDVFIGMANDEIIDDDGERRSLKDLLSDSQTKNLLSTVVGEEIQEIYNWAASDDENYEDD